VRQGVLLAPLGVRTLPTPSTGHRDLALGNALCDAHPTDPRLAKSNDIVPVQLHMLAPLAHQRIRYLELW
jgi:hypothetical protein